MNRFIDNLLLKFSWHSHHSLILSCWVLLCMQMVTNVLIWMLIINFCHCNNGCGSDEARCTRFYS